MIEGKNNGIMMMMGENSGEGNLELTMAKDIDNYEV